MASHTAGPWEIFGEDDVVPGVPALEISRGECGTSEHRSIAYVNADYDEKKDKFVITETTHANASLIAAAPQMLEACQAAKEYLVPDLVEPGRTVFWKLVAAIKAATGAK